MLCFVSRFVQKSARDFPESGEVPRDNCFIRSASALVLAVVGNFIVREPHDVVNAGFVKLSEPFHNQKRGLKLSRFVSGVCLLGTVKIFGKLTLVKMIGVPKLFKPEIHTLPPLLYLFQISGTSRHSARKRNTPSWRRRYFYLCYIMTYYLNL